MKSKIDMQLLRNILPLKTLLDGKEHRRFFKYIYFKPGIVEKYINTLQYSFNF